MTCEGALTSNPILGQSIKSNINRINRSGERDGSSNADTNYKSISTTQDKVQQMLELKKTDPTRFRLALQELMHEVDQ